MQRRSAYWLAFFFVFPPLACRWRSCWIGRRMKRYLCANLVGDCATAVSLKPKGASAELLTMIGSRGLWMTASPNQSENQIICQITFLHFETITARLKFRRDMPHDV